MSSIEDGYCEPMKTYRVQNRNFSLEDLEAAEREVNAINFESSDEWCLADADIAAAAALQDALADMSASISVSLWAIASSVPL